MLAAFSNQTVCRLPADTYSNQEDALAVREELTFTELKGLFDVSDGNLSAHARKLEEASYVTCTKSFEDRRPRTVYRITAVGRNALHRYLDHVEAVIKATRRT